MTYRTSPLMTTPMPTGLSRLPLPKPVPSSMVDTVSIFNMAQVHALPVTFQDIWTATRRDIVLSKVLSVRPMGMASQSQ